MNLQPLVDYLAQQGLGSPGVDLFRDQMPSGVEGLLLTCQTPVLLDPYSSVLKGRFQIIARYGKVDSPRERLQALMHVFGKQGLVLGDMRFMFIQPAHLPLTYPRTSSGQIESSINYDFAFTFITA